MSNHTMAKKSAAAAGGNGSERPSRTTSNYTNTLRLLASAEADLARSFNRWAKLRAKARRLEKRLDAEFNRRAADVPGQIDWRALAGAIIEDEA